MPYSINMIKLWNNCNFLLQWARFHTFKSLDLNNIKHWTLELSYLRITLIHAGLQVDITAVRTPWSGTPNLQQTKPRDLASGVTSAGLDNNKRCIQTAHQWALDATSAGLDSNKRCNRTAPQWALDATSAGLSSNKRCNRTAPQWAPDATSAGLNGW